MKRLFTLMLIFNGFIYSQPEWIIMPSGTTKHIRAIWGTSPTNIYAVGDTGLILHYDGENWLTMESGVTNNINDIIGFSANEIYAVAGRVFTGTTLPGRVLKSKGNSWSVLTSNLLFAGNSIWGTSGSDLWVDGNDGKIYHYNGVQWEALVTFFGFSQLLSIHGMSATEVYAGGSNGHIYHRKDCNQTGNYFWETTAFPASGSAITRIWVSGLNNAFATSEEGMVYRFTGELINGSCYNELWRYDSLFYYSGFGVDALYGIYGISNKLYAYGQKVRCIGQNCTYGSFIAEYDGQKWREMTTHTDFSSYAGINGLWGTDTSNVFAVGNNGIILKFKGEATTEFIVNSTSTRPDTKPGDGICDCGGPLIEGKPECSLVAAVTEANSTESKDKIVFDIPESDQGYDPSLRTFAINPDLSISVLHPVTIDGSTQPGFSGSPVIELDGNSISPVTGKTSAGLTEDGHCLILNGENSRVNGFTFINNKGAAIYIQGGGKNIIEGNYIGTRKGSDEKLSNQIGILVENSSDNIIGGKQDPQRNVISGNSGSGIRIIGSNSKRNSVLGNAIGASDGALFLENGFCGIEIENASGNIIGGEEEGSGNLIGGNMSDGIRFTFSDSNKVKKNIISANKGVGINISNSVADEISGNVMNSHNRYELEISGASSKSITVTGNEFRDSDSGSIHITRGASEIHIGGYNAGESNQIYYGVFVDDPACKKISVVNNLLEIPASWTDGDYLRVPLDLAGHGPTKNPWNGGEGTNQMKAPPRILSISKTQVTGMTRANETAEIYKLRAWGVGKGRYFARSVEPLGHAKADDKGYFTISLSLNEGDILAATSTDEDGNTSELAQIKRPVILLPGIGGSYLNGSNGDQLWLPFPLAAFDYERDNRMVRLGMNPDGTSKEDVKVNGVLEFIAGIDAAYGTILKKITDSGYPSNLLTWQDSKGNGTPPDINTDLYRFANDWRLDQYQLARDLKDRIDWLISDNSLTARSVEVDIVCHSNGGVAAVTYLKAFPEHSQNHVHRFIGIAIPYLGAHKAIGAHTKGYVFEIDHELPFVLKVGSYSPDWSQMLQMSRNIPAAYSLMPSKTYWEASSQFNESFLDNLFRKPIKTYEGVFNFLTKSKSLNGLERNRSLYQSVADRVHNLIDDWRNWNGPPQIFRFAGNKPNSTPVNWWTSPQMYDSRLENIPSDVYRREPGDSELHVKYRSAQMPILGTGDETVPVSSATLGRAFGKMDFSGVIKSDQTKNPWIEEFEYFPCDHNGLLSENCENASGKILIDRLPEILKGGYTVLSESNQSAIIGKVTTSLPQDIIYVSANAPIGVHLYDNEGRHSGPESLDSVKHIEYEIPDVVYFPNEFSSVISLPNGITYNMNIYSPMMEANIQIVRMISNGEDNFRNILFPGQKINAGGGMQFSIRSGVTAETLPLNIDVDGDNNFEGKLNPAILLNSNSPAPAIPGPEPIYVSEVAFIADTSDREVEINFPVAGQISWDWKMSTNSDWISIPAGSGTTPSTAKIILKSKSFSAGTYTDTILVNYRLNDFTLNYAVPVQVDVYEQKNLTGIQVTPESVSLLPGDSVRFYAIGFDQSGDSISFNRIWSANGGVIDNTGLFIAGDSLGIFTVTVTDPSGQIKGQALVNINTVSGIKDGLAGIPTEYFLYTNYPNPFNPTTTIRYAVPFSSEVTISVYNILGEQVGQLLNEVRNPGVYEINWNASNLASGVYVYLIQAKSSVGKEIYSNAKKMILVK